MPAEQRRALVLRAAATAFARDGYAGTTTDVVAREAGVSQPYVVRMFGTKLELFLAVFAAATDGIEQAFTTVVDDGFDPQQESDWARLGQAYSDLLADRDRLLVLMHGFVASGVPEIGEQARRSMAAIYEVIRGAGATAEQARDFVARGMLLNVMIAIDAPGHLHDPGPLAELSRCAFGPQLARLDGAPTGPPPHRGAGARG